MQKNNGNFAFTTNLLFSLSVPTHGKAPPFTSSVQCNTRLAYVRFAIGHSVGTRNLQAEDKQHRLITQLPEFRRHRIDVSSIPVETRLDCEILLAADLEGHRRRVDA